MNKGLIMSIEDNKKAVILTPTGEFCQVPLPKKGQYNIGDELHIKENSFFTSISNVKWGMMAAAVFIIMIMPLLWNNSTIGPVQEVAYVNIDINPSIELALDTNNQVIKAKGLNHDGDKVLSALNLKNTPAQEAINQITTKAEEYKYLATNKENLVVISVTSKDKDKYQELSSNLEKQVESSLNKFDLRGRVETISASFELKAKADQLNLSAGKYAVLLAAMDSGLNISPEEIRSKSIGKAIKAIGGNVGDIVKKAHRANNFDQLSTKYAKKINKSLRTSDSKKVTERQDTETNDAINNEKNENKNSTNKNLNKNMNNTQKDIVKSKNKEIQSKRKEVKVIKDSTKRETSKVNTKKHLDKKNLQKKNNENDDSADAN